MPRPQRGDQGSIPCVVHQQIRSAARGDYGVKAASEAVNLLVRVRTSVVTPLAVDRVDKGSGLENRRRETPPVSSNLTPPASVSTAQPARLP